MVLRQRETKMSSEQPLKKKPKRADDSADADETDFIHNLTDNGVQSNLQALHLSMPPHVNEDDITLNSVNLQYNSKSFLIASDSELEKSVSESDQNDSELTSSTSTQSENLSIPPAPNINTINYQSISSIVQYPRDVEENSQDDIGATQVVQDSTLNTFQQSLVKQCLCGVAETILCKPLEEQPASVLNNRNIILMEWPNSKILQFLSNLQLLFDVYLKQNNKGFICSKIITNCEMIIYNRYNLIEQIISLCESRNKFVHYLAARVLSSFLITAKMNINNEWLESILSCLTTETVNYTKMNFSLEIIKRVVEWKDVEIHVLEETDNQEGSGLGNVNTNCVTVPFRDPESYDTSAIKGLIIKSLESKWPDLIHKIRTLISSHPSVDTQTCILTFLTLWERIISVKANLSVIDINPFYTHLEIFVAMLSSTLPPIIWKQLLSLFNEVLCYGSTLALQDMVPDDTCQLAHLVVRYVKDYRLLDSLP